MYAVRFTHLTVGLAICTAFLAIVQPLQADSKHDYSETGTVISVTNDGGKVYTGNIYTIETDAKIYKMECVAAKLLHSTPPLCEISGKPIGIEDRIHFRLEDDSAYIPANGNKEEKLVVISTELKTLPPLPVARNFKAGESCAVLGLGKDLTKSPYSFGGASPSASTGPVMAIPVTGGPPVPVIASGSGSGTVVTGVNATNGAPVTAISIEPNSGTSTGEPFTYTASVWVPFLRVQTSGHVYKLACASRECWLENRAPQLGDVLTIRIKNNTAYLSWQSPGPKGEQKFTILGVNDIEASPATPLL